jgi:hypothetical protein
MMCIISLHCDVTICLENHQSEGSPGLDVSEDELGKHVQTNLGVRDSLDYTDGQREDHRDS